MSQRPTTDAIWTQLSTDLWRFIRRRVADDHTADDLVQETFVRVHRNLAALEERDRVAAWVYRIARNVVHDHFRKAAGAAASLAGADPAEEASGRTQEQRSRSHQWLTEMIHALPEGYRQAVELAELEELSHQEAADRLGLSLSAAKSRIQRGRAMLKETLQRCCTFEFDRRGNLVDCQPLPDRTVCRKCDE